MTLVKWLPEQVVDMWDGIAELLEDSLPPSHRDEVTMTNVLRAILADDAQFWVVQDDLDTVAAVALTTIREDKVVLSLSLVLYAVRSLRTLTLLEWTDALKKLQAYGKAMNCSSLIAYSNIPEVVEFGERFGGVSETYIIEFKLR